jgi:hypothetical protein
MSITGYDDAASTFGCAEYGTRDLYRIQEAGGAVHEVERQHRRRMPLIFEPDTGVLLNQSGRRRLNDVVVTVYSRVFTSRSTVSTSAFVRHS